VKSRLLWKFLVIVAFVIALDMLIVWLAIDLFAADYFSFLMEKYNLPKDEVQYIFLDAAHRYILWGGLVAFTLGLLISLILIKQVLKPIYQMASITGKIAQGDYTKRVQVMSSDEIGELATSFNMMIHSLDKFERIREDMVANVAHELRAPLTNMRGYLEALSDGVLPPSQKTLELLHDETLRLVTLTDELLLLSKADVARTTLDLKQTDLQECVNQVLDLFKASFTAKEITVETEFPEKLIEVKADRSKLGQVLHNLFQNALQYTPRGGRVRIVVEQSHGWSKTSFSNTGDGIGEKDLPFIFERFYRAEKSRSREYGGAGIGLAIVKELVAAHGGQTGAESSDKETRVWFTLPV
jgi:two-component system, OmpR family, sensor histidine kinase BaeS